MAAGATRSIHHPRGLRRRRGRPDRDCEDERRDLHGTLRRLPRIVPSSILYDKGGDVGCGNGYHTLQLARRVGADGRVLAVDVQPPMSHMLRGATTRSAGPELWCTDGTAAGARLVRDIVAGPGSSGVRELTAAGGRLYYVVTVPTHGVGALDVRWKRAPSISPRRIPFDLLVGSANRSVTRSTRCSNERMRLSCRLNAMTKTPTRVTIVVEPEFQGQLIELARRTDVWVVDTPHNRGMAEKSWRQEPRDSYRSITIFDADSAVSPERWVVDVLGTVDDHHGLRTDWAADVELEVRGMDATAEIRAALKQFGSFVIEELDHAFVARRGRGV